VALRPSRALWWICAAVAAAVAVLAVAQWVGALASGRPVIYGEGAVAHAALLLRDGATYRDGSGAVAANYPPLYLALAGLGPPLIAGRAVTIASALAVAALVAWRARTAGGLVSAALGLGWLALAPVAIWGAAAKPDVLAVALTFAAVVALERSRGRGAAAAAGVLLALAVWTKPTALLPAATVLAWAFVAAGRAFMPALGGAVVVALGALSHAVLLGLDDVWRHVVTWNALAWSAEQVGLVAVLALATVGILVAATVASGGARGLALAYLIGAIGVAVLAGREGATINYLLDLAAATTFAFARIAATARDSAGVPLAAVAQIAVAFAFLAPFGVVPGRDPATGAWGRPERAEVVRALGPGSHLVEDSGLLIAAGREPVVDDLFLWSRLVGAGVVDPTPVLALVRRGELASVVSETDLDRLAQAPAYERARWDPALVRAVLDRYALERSADGLWVYRPR